MGGDSKVGPITVPLTRRVRKDRNAAKMSRLSSTFVRKLGDLDSDINAWKIMRSHHLVGESLLHHSHLCCRDAYSEWVGQEGHSGHDYFTWPFGELFRRAILIDATGAHLKSHSTTLLS